MTQMAIFSRLVRSDMIATLKENYILAARSKGLSDGYILRRHALRPSSLSLMTIVGINFGALLGGTVVIETLFAIPGLGFRLINAISQRDILVIQGITVFVARGLRADQHTRRPALHRGRSSHPEGKLT